MTIVNTDKMNEIYLAVKPDPNYGDPLCQRDAYQGILATRFIHDANKISDFLRTGWKVFQLRGLHEVTDVTLELKIEAQDAWSKSTEPA